MKKILLAISILVFSCTILYAVPAYPGYIKHRQPDGRYVNVQIHGDEFYHYTTLNGKVVALGKDGYYHPAVKPTKNVRELHSLRNTGRKAVRRAGEEDVLTKGEKRFLVMLIEFSDMSFSVLNPQDAFSRLLNEQGYSDNNGTGSAFDYYYENSSHQFIPTYDVIGPIKLSKAYAEYGGNNEKGRDKDASSVLKDACKIANEQGLVNFANYDNDKDGYVDNIFFFYAGHNEAEGGGEDTIWPHASALNGVRYDGVYVHSYACTSEYRGSSGNNMAGIGTFCHEFGHVLGLPDFYDVDYEENGSASTIYAFSLMCNGSYNNNGRTPPYLGAVERTLLGWSEIKDWTTSGPKSVRPVYENDGYATPTSMDGEYFVYEVRDGTGWDRYILAKSTQNPPRGMVIYHLDMSNRDIFGDPAYLLWSYNELNNYAVHPCYYLVKPNPSYSDYNDMLWPGTSGKTSFEGTDWNGLSTGFVLSDIQYQDGTVSLNLAIPDSKTLAGTVTNSKGEPLQGVKVSIAPTKSAGVQALKRGKRLISQKALEAASEYTTYTDASGKYEVSMPLGEGDDYEATFSLEMYNAKTQTVNIPSYKANLDVVLYNFSEGAQATLRKYESMSSYAIGFTSEESTYSGTLAVKFTADELKDVVGYELKTINFRINGNPATQVDVFVDFDAERVFTRKVDNVSYGNLTTVDISDAGLIIPSGVAVYIGYAVKDTPTQYWIAIDSKLSDGDKGGGMFRGGYFETGSLEWQESGYNIIVSADVKQVVPPFNSMGIKVIHNPGDGEYAVGSTFKLMFDNPGAGDTPDSTSWTFDGTPVSGSQVTLSTAGRHTVKAILTYADGSTEEIVQEIEVK